MQIRELQKSDVDPVAAIWLNTNLKTHDFIAAQYWKDNFAPVKAMLSQAEVYVYETDRKIQGFIGLNGEYIEGIFVSDEMQSQGVGLHKRQKSQIDFECVPEKHTGNTLLP